MFQHFVADFILKSAKKECAGKELSQRNVFSIYECATMCRRVSSMFIVGRAGSQRCFSDYGECKCMCEVAANSGSCKELDNEHYDLYEFNDDSNLHFEKDKNVNCE